MEWHLAHCLWSVSISDERFLQNYVITHLLALPLIELLGLTKPVPTLKTGSIVWPLAVRLALAIASAVPRILSLLRTGLKMPPSNVLAVDAAHCAGNAIAFERRLELWNICKF